MNDALQHMTQVKMEAEQLYSAQQVAQALNGMAQKIDNVLGQSNPLLLCVLTGGIPTTGALLNRLTIPLQVDYIHATRYQGNTRGEALQWLAYPRTELSGRVVLVIDDILDEGLTLAAILAHCKEKGAKAVYSAVLVQKMHDRSNGLVADFTGLQVEDRYVFGYGMDYQEYWRNAQGIYAVKGL